MIVFFSSVPCIREKNSLGRARAGQHKVNRTYMQHFYFVF